MMITKGTPLIFTHGEVEARQFDGPYAVLKDFEQLDVLKTYRESFAAPPDQPYAEPNESDFIQYLVKQGYIHAPSNTVQWELEEIYFDEDLGAELDE